MASHLTCKPLDLERIAQSLVSKLLERGMLDDAQSAIEAMLLSLSSSYRRPLAPIKCNAGASGGDWEQALELLLCAHEAGRKQIGTDECAVIAVCLHSLASLAIARMESPTADQSQRASWLRTVLATCGPGCLRWARALLAADPDAGRKLCGNFARAAARGAAVADALSRAENASLASSVKVAGTALPPPPPPEAGLELRRLSTVFSALHGKVLPADLVAQWIKVTRCGPPASNSSPTFSCAKISGRNT